MFQNHDAARSPESPEFWSVEGREKELFTNTEKSPMVKGGDFCPVDLDGGDLEGGWRREAVDGYPGHRTVLWQQRSIGRGESW